ncbi:MAG: hypothetical protein DRH26_06235, partial [Deltaproteobacteria bacterium]
FRTVSERPNRALQEPEPPALKGARAVLRGRGCGNTPLLPDCIKSIKICPSRMPNIRLGREKDFEEKNGY